MKLRALAMPLVRALREPRRRWEQGPSSWETVPVAPAPSETDAAFDGARAFGLLRDQCEMGPRVAGTDGHARTLAWMIEALRPCVDALVVQRWDQKVGRGPGAGRTFRMANVLARVRGTDDEEGAVPGLMLSTHWDTRPVADKDPDPAKRHLPVPGANDGASGVAVLLEAARALRARRPARSVVLGFWDGEDMGEYYYGSRAYARELRAGRAPWGARRGIVLDMVARPDLRCNTEAHSLRLAPALWREVHDQARALGLGAHFGGPAAAIMDDHVFLGRAGIPSILLIDYAYPQWHTTDDTVEHCDPRSLQVAGDLVLHVARADAPRPTAGSGAALDTSTPAPPPYAREREGPLVSLYFGANLAWTRTAALLQAVYDGVWLGVLGRESLYGIDRRFYDGNAVYHGDAHNLLGLMAWEEAALSNEAFAGCRRLLVLGAGGGREVLALARRGYEVEGYECNQALVDYAAHFLPRQECAATVRHLPREALPTADAPFDGIILGWASYMLMPGRTLRVDLLRRLIPLIKPGGPILLSFWTRPGDGARFRLSAAVANLLRVPLRRERVLVGDALQPNYVHYFVPAEVAEELRLGGWEPHRYAPPGPGGRDSAWAIGLAPAAEAGPA
jgi:SAM-dependent methyltransferase